MDGSDGDSEESTTFGLEIQSANVTVRGFTIENMSNNEGDAYGIGVTGVSGNSHVWIYGNTIGTDPSGQLPFPNTDGGILIDSGVSGVLIGTNADGVDDFFEHNVISANSNDGVDILGSGNTVYGNYIGLAGNGFQDLGNAGAGIRVSGSNNIIGGIDPGQQNIIAFNAEDGVVVEGGAGNTIRGNEIFENEERPIRITGEGTNNLQQPPQLLGNTLDAETISIIFKLPPTTDSEHYPLNSRAYKFDDELGTEEALIGSFTYNAAQAKRFRRLFSLLWPRQCSPTTSSPSSPPMWTETPRNFPTLST